MTRIVGPVLSVGDMVTQWMRQMLGASAAPSAHSRSTVREMSAKCWFSTKVRLVCLLESGGGMGYRDSVFLLRADDFDDAFRRALAVGRAEERTYLNGNGLNVRWALTEVISVDWLGEHLEDGVEVYSEPLELEIPDGIGFDTRFAPERSKPTQTV